MMSGFIVMQRAALDHPLLKDGERFRAWFWMCASACWRPTRFDIGGKMVTLERGQLCASRSQMAKEWGWSESAVERFLTRLKTEQMIERETGQGRSIITICNYEKYQDISDPTGQGTGRATGQRSDSDRTAKEPLNKGTKNPPLPPKGKAPLDYAQIQKRWNDLAAKHGLPICEVMTDRRRSAIRARFNEYDLDAIHRAIDAVFVSSFCLGRKKDFRADFDFVFQAKSFGRLIEGSYSDERSDQPVSPEQAALNRQTLARLALARRRYPDLPAHKAVVKIIEEEQRQMARTAGRN